MLLLLGEWWFGMVWYGTGYGYIIRVYVMKMITIGLKYNIKHKTNGHNVQWQWQQQ